MIGVVGDDGAVTETVEDAGVATATGSAEDVLAAGPDRIVVVGEPALLDLVRAEASVPVLPVAAGRGVRSVPRAALSDAVGALTAGDWYPVDRPVLGVRVGGDPAGRALADVTLMTSEPAHISEYAIRSGDERVAQIRADGVVVATPVGSHGYAKDAGGSLVAPGTDVVQVAPVAPFVTDADRWVLPATDLELSVERDESDVSLLVDDETTRRVPPGVEVTVNAIDAVTVAVVPQSRPFFGD